VVSCNHHAVGHWSTHSWKPKPKKEVNSETAEVKQPFGRNFAGLCSKNNTHTHKNDQKRMFTLDKQNTHWNFIEKP